MSRRLTTVFFPASESGFRDSRVDAEQHILETAREVEPQFDEITHCGCCEHVLSGLIYKRLYEVSGGLALTILCAECNRAVPAGSAADSAFRAGLERAGALVRTPPQGRA
jgi:hypothetical protein